jgi:hypothetical protein
VPFANHKSSINHNSIVVPSTNSNWQSNTAKCREHIPTVDHISKIPPINEAKVAKHVADRPGTHGPLNFANLDHWRFTEFLVVFCCKSIDFSEFYGRFFSQATD